MVVDLATGDVGKRGLGRGGGLLVEGGGDGEHDIGVDGYGVVAGVVGVDHEVVAVVLRVAEAFLLIELCGKTAANNSAEG